MSLNHSTEPSPVGRVISGMGADKIDTPASLDLSHLDYYDPTEGAGEQDELRGDDMSELEDDLRAEYVARNGPICRHDDPYECYLAGCKINCGKMRDGELIGIDEARRQMYFGPTQQ